MSEFEHTIGRHTTWLRKKGYDEEALNGYSKPGFFIRQLRYAFGSCIQQSSGVSGKQDFELTTTGFFNQDMDIVQFRFFYEFDPAKSELYLQKLVATMNGAKMEFKITENKTDELPRAIQVHNAFRGKNILKTSGRAIPTHNTKRKGIKH